MTLKHLRLIKKKEKIKMILNIFLSLMTIIAFFIITILFIGIIRGVKAAKGINGPNAKIKVRENIVTKIIKEKKTC
jgi:hypothetical protein